MFCQSASNVCLKMAKTLILPHSDWQSGGLSMVTMRLCEHWATPIVLQAQRSSVWWRLFDGCFAWTWFHSGQDERERGLRGWFNSSSITIEKHWLKKKKKIQYNYNSVLQCVTIPQQLPKKLFFVIVIVRNLAVFIRK